MSPFAGRSFAESPRRRLTFRNRTRAGQAVITVASDPTRVADAVASASDFTNRQRRRIQLV
jgi:hypothetical protein